MSSLGNAASKVTSQIAESSDAIEKSGIKQALLAVNDMVESANKLNAAMGSLPDLKLDAKLKAYANGVGLGGKFNYQIKNKDVVINVNMSVTMNADELEKALVLREKSIIRSRLNFATDESTHDKSTVSLPATPGPVVIPPAPK